MIVASPGGRLLGEYGVAYTMTSTIAEKVSDVLAMRHGAGLELK